MTSLAVSQIGRYESHSCDGAGGEVELTEEERSEVVGRVLGTATRRDHFEVKLRERVRGAEGDWVRVYQEEGRFGLGRVELDADADGGMVVNEILRDDPLLRLARAECLLALFVEGVEWPAYDKAGRERREIDFVDEERRGVILSSVSKLNTNKVN